MKSIFITNCCSVLSGQYTGRLSSRNKSKYKAGVVLHNTITDKVLLIQSRGFKWGFPKGSQECYDNGVVDCAIREMEEETGIRLDTLQVLSKKVIKINKAWYFYVPIKEHLEYTLHHRTEITGIGWVHISCLRTCIETNSLNVNSACRKILSLPFIKDDSTI